jgi:hypothetical protein
MSFSLFAGDVKNRAQTRLARRNHREENHLANQRVKQFGFEQNSRSIVAGQGNI